MTTKPPPPAPPPAPPQNKNAFVVPAENGETTSQGAARLVTDGVTSALTVVAYADCGDSLEVRDLVKAMERAGDEAVSGNMARTERMLANQLLTLDAMFHNLARRARAQTQFDGIEKLTRLALKAQSQARATAETLGLLKNPAPYIRQANIAHGPQQVNNGVQPARTGEINSVPNKQLEQQHGNRMDFGTATTASRGNTDMEAVGEVNRPNKRSGKGKGGA